MRSYSDRSGELRPSASAFRNWYSLPGAKGQWPSHLRVPSKQGRPAGFHPGRRSRVLLPHDGDPRSGAAIPQVLPLGMRNADWFPAVAAAMAWQAEQQPMSLPAKSDKSGESCAQVIHNLMVVYGRERVKRELTDRMTRLRQGFHSRRGYDATSWRDGAEMNETECALNFLLEHLVSPKRRSRTVAASLCRGDRHGDRAPWLQLLTEGSRAD